MSKRTDDEILKAIHAALAQEKENGNEDEDMAPWDADMERVFMMSAEERQRVIEAAGIDLSALYARADEVHAKMEAEAAASPAGASGAGGAGDKDVRLRSDDAGERNPPTKRG